MQFHLKREEWHSESHIKIFSVIAGLLCYFLLLCSGQLPHTNPLPPPFRMVDNDAYGVTIHSQPDNVYYW